MCGILAKASALEKVERLEKLERTDGRGGGQDYIRKRQRCGKWIDVIDFRGSQ